MKWGVAERSVIRSIKNQAANPEKGLAAFLVHRRFGDDG
jgi:hypothetical protein